MGKLKLSIKSLALVLFVLLISPVQAYDCVLDTDGDGIGNGTAGASSLNSTSRLACGNTATAGAANSVALGSFASTAGNSSTAVGTAASAIESESTALGRSASAAGVSSTAVGYSAEATFSNSTAVGASAEATASQSTAVGVSADATASNSTALGVSAEATASSSTAVGAFAEATAIFSTALGRSASAAGVSSTALGDAAEATANFSTAVGVLAFATATNSTAVGVAAEATSEGAVSVGYSAGSNSPAVTDSPQAIAIGEWSNITAAAPGAIAIGGDVDGDSIGAQATAEGAIAIGADVVADIPHTLVTNVPILARDPDTTVVPRTMFEISGFGNTKFTVTNADQNEQWSFANPGTGFRLSRQGSGSVEFEVKNNGNAVLAGTLTENSDVNAKQDILPLDQQAILDKVMELDISEWRYKDDPNSKHIGPMAQDFYQAFELGHTEKGISTLDSSGVALAAIQALKAQSDAEIADLKAEKDGEVAELKSEIATMQLQLMEMNEIKQQLALVLAMTGSVQLTQVISE